MGLAGCGDSEDFANEPRPPTPINIDGAIDEQRVTIDPASFGAGPIVLRVANLTADPLRVTIKGPSLSQTSSPINPGGPGTMKLDIDEGRYTVSVNDDGIRSARIRVGAERPSSQDELLQP